MTKNYRNINIIRFVKNNKFKYIFIKILDT